MAQNKPLVDQWVLDANVIAKVPEGYEVISSRRLHELYHDHLIMRHLKHNGLESTEVYEKAMKDYRETMW